MNSESEFQLNKRHIARHFARAAASYDRVAVLQREIGERLSERLEVLKLVPAQVLDVGCGTGHLTRALARRYAKATVYGLDIAPPLLRVARGKRGWFSRSAFVAGDAERLPIASDSVDLLVSNLALQWCELEAAFPEFLRVLRPGGAVFFTTFGPDTLHELRAAWAAVDSDVHVHRFLDMHDVGDALARAGFADAVMDVERLTLEYADPREVLRDLKALGANNAAGRRAPGLLGKDRFQRFLDAYAAQRVGGKIPASYEVVFGHAWAPAQKPVSRRRADGHIAVPLSSLRRRP